MGLPPFIVPVSVLFVTLLICWSLCVCPVGFCLCVPWLSLCRPWQADPHFRVRASAEVQTLWWRAPEVLFGERHFGQAVDVWSLGLVLAELGGWRFQAELQGKIACQVGYTMAIFQQLGTPGDLELTELPAWPAKAPQFCRRPWPHKMVARLGGPGCDVLDAMLAWVPSQRPTAAKVADHGFISPTRFNLHGGSCLQGNRHPWNVCVGTVAVEVLQWLRADSALRPGSPEFQALAIDFQAKRKDCKSESGRKFILAGALGDDCCSRTMCGLSLARPLPVPRVQAWRAALLHVNAGAFAALEASAKKAVQRLPAEHRGRNGEQFLECGFRQWLCSCGELSFVEPGSAEAGFWAEAAHQDGGASVMHLGLTLFGRRALTCRQGLGLPDVRIPNVPGTAYMGQLTGPWHQVTHEAAAPRDLLEVPGLGPCAVTVMMRTALFGFDRARQRNTTPSPVPLFEALARSFREAFVASALRLPTLAECEAHLREQASPQLLCFEYHLPCTPTMYTTMYVRTCT